MNGRILKERGGKLVGVMAKCNIKRSKDVQAQQHLKYNVFICQLKGGDTGYPKNDDNKNSRQQRAGKLSCLGIEQNSPI